jgi:hypothetical protein
MMTVMTLYVGHCSKKRSGTYWNKYGPLYLTVISGLLILMEPTRHVFMDHVSVSGAIGEYRDGCNAEDVRCLSYVGWLVTIGATYIGFTMFFIGTLWNANIMSKLRAIRMRWRAIRASHQQHQINSTKIVEQA